VTVATKAKTSTAPKQNQQQMLIIGGIVVVALIAVIALIALSGQTAASTIDYASLPQARTPEGGFVIGDPNAPITIIEFADYACPACQTYFPEIERFVADFVVTGQARFEYHVFPTAGGAQTAFAGDMAECMDNAQPGAFWKAYTRFNQLAQQGSYPDAPRILARELGLNYSDLLACEQDNSMVEQSVALGQQLRVEGTPAVRVRYGNDAPTFIFYAGQSFERGPVSYDVLAGITQQANAGVSADGS
jgi:protein-disulfide isomerase